MSYLLLPRKIPCQPSHSCLSMAFSSSPMLDIITIKTRSFVPSDRVNGNLRSLSYGSQLCSCLSLPYGNHHYHKAKAALRTARPSRQDRGAGIHFKQLHFRVFSMSRFELGWSDHFSSFTGEDKTLQTAVVIFRDTHLLSFTGGPNWAFICLDKLEEGVFLSKIDSKRVIWSGAEVLSM